MRKRFLCLLTVIVLCGFAFASDVKLQAMTGSGQCGESITWNLDAAGKLTIAGSGDFYGEDNENYLPWGYLSRYIVEVSISDGIASVPDCAFRSCDFLESVTLGTDVKSVGRESFAGCVRLTDISGANGLESIEEAAFASCTALTDFDFNGIQTIGVSSFSNSGLLEVVIADSVQEIGENAFSDCVKLESILIGQGVTYLDRYVFSNCQSMETVTIPATVTAIDEGAFSSCEISDVYYAGTAAQWNRIRGGGADYLKYCSEKVFFESTGPENAVHLTFEIKAERQDEDYFEFSVNADGNGFQRVYVARCYYDNDGKFLETDISDQVFPTENKTYSGFYWNGLEQRPGSVKLMVLDVKLKPLCPCGYGSFSID